MASWNEENTLLKTTKLTESYYANKKVNYKKLHSLIDKGKIVWKEGDDIKKGDRVVCYNGMYYVGIVDVKKIDYEYGVPSIWGNVENTDKRFGTDIGSGANVIVDDSIEESDFAYNTKVFSVHVEFKGEVGYTRLELPDYITVEDIEKGISLSVEEEIE